MISAETEGRWGVWAFGCIVWVYGSAKSWGTHTHTSTLPHRFLLPVYPEGRRDEKAFLPLCPSAVLACFLQADMLLSELWFWSTFSLSLRTERP